MGHRRGVYTCSNCAFDLRTHARDNRKTQCLEATGLEQVQQTSVELCSIKKCKCTVQEYPSCVSD